jgi:hypothetical protein
MGKRKKERNRFFCVAMWSPLTQNESPFGASAIKLLKGVYMRKVFQFCPAMEQFIFTVLSLWIIYIGDIR